MAHLALRTLATIASISLYVSGSRAVAGEPAVAEVGGQPITARELDERTAAKVDTQRHEVERRIKELQVRAARERYAYLEQQINLLVDERALALEATAKKTTGAALTAALPLPKITDAELRAFYESNKAQISQPYDTVSAKIRTYLEQSAVESARRRYFDSLRKKHGAVVSLEPLREPVAPSGPSRGPADAPVTIVEFSDFQCPYCGRYAPVLREVLAKYPKQVRWVYRHMPLSSLHPDAQKSAEAAACAEQQGKFWEMHDLLFADQSKLGIAALKETAKNAGLDLAKFNDCLDSGKSREHVRADQLAAEQLALAGTPASFINGRFLDGARPLEDLTAIIDDELHRAATTARR